MIAEAWEKKFEASLQKMPANVKEKAGSVLSVIPNRDEWEDFINVIKGKWSNWESFFNSNPGCMVVLYDGVAFYHYKSGAFWDDFSNIVSSSAISANFQKKINVCYARSARRFDLPITDRDFVGSAVFHIGIPISMWAGFLHICEWALWINKWDSFDGEIWSEAIKKRLGGQQRLINFLVGNQIGATQFIREMLDARRILSDDKELTVTDIKQAIFLRAEYFDEVPETADFLRPNDPDSLFADRGRLAWDEERQVISLYLPPVKQDLLPATWRLNKLEKAAANTAITFPINSEAFKKMLHIQLTSNSGKISAQNIAGIGEWALYDEVRQRFVHHNRDLLPISQYTIISRCRLNPELVGWQRDQDDPNVDLESKLIDGTQIFLTRLFAVSRRPKLKIRNEPQIEFSQRSNITLRIFCGGNELQKNAGRFSIDKEGVVNSELWPTPFIEVPLSLVNDNEIESEFTIFLDGQPASGKWKIIDYDPCYAEAEHAERGFYGWCWENISAPTQSLKFSKSFENHTLSVQSRRLGQLVLGSAAEYRFNLLPSTPDELWPKAWDGYMAWVLISQVQNKATWEEVGIAREAVAGSAEVDLKAVYYQIKKLEKHDYLTRRGHRYINFRSRIVLTKLPNGFFGGEYCGLTSKLYDLVRKVLPVSLSVVQVEQGRPATLHIEWEQCCRYDVKNACQYFGVEIVQHLWSKK